MNNIVTAAMAIFLIIAAVGFTKADWLDDLNDGTSQLVSVVNENAGKINTLAANINILGKILKDLDPDSKEE